MSMGTYQQRQDEPPQMPPLAGAAEHVDQPAQDEKAKQRDMKPQASSGYKTR